MTNSEHPSIHRHPALHPLSRDHHYALVQAMNLKRYSSQNEEVRFRIARDFIIEWDKQIAIHLEEEENLLSSLMSTESKKRLDKEHAEFRRYAFEIQSFLINQRCPDKKLLLDTATLLNDHVRWEERELYFEIERNASEGVLEALRAKTELFEISRPRNQS